MLHYLIIPRQDFFISVEVKGLSNPSTSQRLHHELLLVWWQSNISTLPIVEACPSPFLTQLPNKCRPLSRKHLTLERGEAEGVSDRSIAAIVRTHLILRASLRIQQCHLLSLFTKSLIRNIMQARICQLAVVMYANRKELWHYVIKSLWHSKVVFLFYMCDFNLYNLSNKVF